MSSVANALHPGFTPGPYAERDDPRLSWLDNAGERVVGAALRRVRARAERARRFARRVEAVGPAMKDLSDAAVAEVAVELRNTLRRGGMRVQDVARCFALVREVAHRRLGMRHHEVQVMGGWVMLSGMVAEMETGEGKTLTATLAASTAALAGLPVHVITVNDYLVARDADEMRPVYAALGLSVSAVQHGMQPAQRRAAYACDVTYCSNKELTFDYLKDRISMGRMRTRVRMQLERMASGASRADELLLRGLCFAIVDEVDSVLIDEARTPLIIAGGGDADPIEEDIYKEAVDLAAELVEDEDYRLDHRDRHAVLSQHGAERLEELAAPLGGVWKGPYRRNALISQALSALHLYERDLHYLVDEGKVQIIDEYTGRVMADRHWQHGLHQMIETKEGCEITGSSDPLAQISYQRFFRRYLHLAGMSGTAQEVAGELWSVYRLPVVRIPTNKPLRRQNLGDRVYATLDGKWAAVVQRVQEMYQAGRPLLVGTRSVEASEHLSRLLEAAGLPHQVLNARQDKQEAEIVAQAGKVGGITVATNMAGRGTDIRLPDEVKQAGGLHVIATERHESHRIDRQLFGRCARQGDPGSFETIVSLEDPLVMAHGLRLSGFLSGSSGEPVARGKHAAAAEQAERAEQPAPAEQPARAESDGAVRSAQRMRTVVGAQRRAERLHAAVRKQLFKTDQFTEDMLAFSGRGE